GRGGWVGEESAAEQREAGGVEGVVQGPGGMVLDSDRAQGGKSSRGLDVGAAGKHEVAARGRVVEWGGLADQGAATAVDGEQRAGVGSGAGEDGARGSRGAGRPAESGQGAREPSAVIG